MTAKIIKISSSAIEYDFLHPDFIFPIFSIIKMEYGIVYCGVYKSVRHVYESCKFLHNDNIHQQIKNSNNTTDILHVVNENICLIDSEWLEKPYNKITILKLALENKFMTNQLLAEKLLATDEYLLESDTGVEVFDKNNKLGEMLMSLRKNIRKNIENYKKII